FWGINAAGQIVGRYGLTGFLYSGGTYTDINPPGGETFQGGTAAAGINDSGQIAGWYTTGLNAFTGFRQHGYVYSGGSYTTLDDPLASGATQANGINNFGTIV